MDQFAVLTLAITKLLISSVEGDFQTTNLKFKCQTKNVKIKLVTFVLVNNGDVSKYEYVYNAILSSGAVQ